MIYLGMALLWPVIWFLPWWMMAITAALAGAALPRSRFDGSQFALAAGLVSAGLAYIKDGRAGGVISHRLGELLGLPFSALIFALVFLVAALTAYLCFRAGRSVLELCRIVSRA